MAAPYCWWLPLTADGFHWLLKTVICSGWKTLTAHDCILLGMAVDVCSWLGMAANCCPWPPWLPITSHSLHWVATLDYQRLILLWKAALTANGYRWLSCTADGSCWMPFPRGGVCPWLTMAAFASCCLWIPLLSEVALDCLWQLLVALGCRWMPLAENSYPWLLITANDCPLLHRLPLTVNGCPWLNFAVVGCLWLLMASLYWGWLL
jgi:hypothetical protein